MLTSLSPDQEIHNANRAPLNTIDFGYFDRLDVDVFRLIIENIETQRLLMKTSKSLYNYITTEHPEYLLLNKIIAAHKKHLLDQSRIRKVYRGLSPTAFCILAPHSTRGLNDYTITLRNSGRTAGDHLAYASWSESAYAISNTLLLACTQVAVQGLSSIQTNLSSYFHADYQPSQDTTFLVNMDTSLSLAIDEELNRFVKSIQEKNGLIYVESIASEAQWATYFLYKVNLRGSISTELADKVDALIKARAIKLS